MKKFLALFLVLAMGITLCACESKEDRAKRQIKEAGEAIIDALG